MKSDFKKMAPPIIATAIIIVYLIFYFVVLFALLEGIMRILFLVVPVISAILLIAVCLERIKEIKDGEENDISKY